MEMELTGETQQKRDQLIQLKGEPEEYGRLPCGAFWGIQCHQVRVAYGEEEAAQDIWAPQFTVLEAKAMDVRVSASDRGGRRFSATKKCGRWAQPGGVQGDVMTKRHTGS